MNWLRLHVSNLCNFKCPNCHVFELGENDLPNRVMSQDVFDKAVEVFIDSLIHLNFKETMISIYGGETLANKKVIKEGLLKFGENYKGIKIHWVMNTNGSLLKEEDVLFFKKNKLEIHVSVDGKEEVHNLSRPTHQGKGTYHMVTPALDLIKKHEAPSQINSYMMPSNYNHLKDLVDIAAEYNISKIYLDQFYNLDMITHKIGMKRYMSVYLYGMSKGVQISGPWKKVINNFQNEKSREQVLSETLYLDVNIDGSCYFPIYNESKYSVYHIDTFLDSIKSGLHSDISKKTMKRSARTCDGCSIREHCNGLAIEQVHYHIGAGADTKVSCDFFRDWCHFLMRPIYFRKEKRAHFISMIDLDTIGPLVKKVNVAITDLEEKLWPLHENITVNIVEHFEEMLLASKSEYLPEWVSAVTSGNTLYLKGPELSPAIVHELTHIFLNQESLNLPDWIEEGLCEWVQGKKVLKDISLDKNIHKMNRKDLMKGFDDKRPGENLLYAQSHSFIIYLEKILGRDLLKQAILATSEQDFSLVLEHFTGANLSDHLNLYKRQQ